MNFIDYFLYENNPQSQSPIPNHQSPIPNPQSPIYKYFIKLNL